MSWSSERSDDAAGIEVKPRSGIVAAAMPVTGANRAGVYSRLGQTRSPDFGVVLAGTLDIRAGSRGEVNVEGRWGEGLLPIDRSDSRFTNRKNRTFSLMAGYTFLL